MSQSSFTVEPPKLAIVRKENRLSLSYSLAVGTGAVTFYQSEDAAKPVQDWMPVGVAPAPSRLIGEFGIRLEGQSAQFFTLEQNTNQISQSMVWIRAHS